MPPTLESLPGGLLGEEASPTSDIQPTPIRPPWRPMMPPELFDPEIGPDGIAVYGALCLHVDGKTGECWPSQDAIAKRLGISRKRVSAAIDRLIARDFVLLLRDHGFQGSRKYHLPHQVNAPIRHNQSESAKSAHSEMLQNGTSESAKSAHTESAKSAHEPYVSEPYVKEPTKGETPPAPPVGGTPPTEPTEPTKPGRKTALPVGFVLTDERRDWAMGKGLTAPQAAIAFERFKNHAESVDRRQVSWDASWRTWVLGDIQKGVFQGVKSTGRADRARDEIDALLRIGGVHRES